MKYHIDYSPVGFQEYDEAFKWYLERSETAADNFVKEILEKIEIISLDPFRFRNTYDIFRETSLTKFPILLYLLFMKLIETLLSYRSVITKEIPGESIRNSDIEMSSIYP